MEKQINLKKRTQFERIMLALILVEGVLKEINHGEADETAKYSGKAMAKLGRAVLQLSDKIIELSGGWPE